MTGLPEKYRAKEPAGGNREKGSRSPELDADGFTARTDSQRRELGAGVGRELMSGKGSARRAWSGTRTTKQSKRRGGAGPGRCWGRRLACVTVTGRGAGSALRGLSSEAKANRDEN